MPSYTIIQQPRDLRRDWSGSGCYSIGLLGATGMTPDEAEANRLLEIERRILAIEATLEATHKP